MATTSRRSFLAGSLGGLALAAAGCSSSNGDKGKASASGGTTGAGPTTAGSSAAASSASTSDIKGEITVWDFDTEALAKYETDLFNKVYPNIKVNNVVQPTADYAKLVQAALTTSQGPDALRLHAPTEVVKFAPALLDLTSRVTPEQKTNLVGWEQMSPQGDTSKGIFGLPMQLTNLVFYYNKALFTKAGLDPTKPPSTVPELTDAVAKLRAAGIEPIAGGDKEHFMALFYFWLFQSTQLTLEDVGALAGGQMKWASQKPKAVMQMFLDLVKANSFNASWRSDSILTDMPDRFVSGRAAMALHQNNRIAQFYTGLKDDLGVFIGVGAAPGEQPNFVSATAGLSMCVAKRSPNPDAAYAWCAWKLSKESQERDLTALSSADKMGNGRLPTDKRVKPGADAYPPVRDLVEALASAKLGAGIFQHPKYKLAVQTAAVQGSSGLIDGRTSLDSYMESLDKANNS